jgi:hypothetical protein
VGTVTEIYDYLRLLFGRAGEPHCPHCDRSISPQSLDQMLDLVMELPERTRFQILAPVVRGKKGTHQKLLSALAAEGFVRVRINGDIRDLNDNIELNKNHAHTIEVVVDRLVMKADLQERLADSLTTCLKRSDGIAVIDVLPERKSDADNKVVPIGAAQNLSDRLPVPLRKKVEAMVLRSLSRKRRLLKSSSFPKTLLALSMGPLWKSCRLGCFPSTRRMGPVPIAMDWAACARLPQNWWCRMPRCRSTLRSPPGPKKTIPIIFPCSTASVRPLALRFKTAGKPSPLSSKTLFCTVPKRRFTSKLTRATAIRKGITARMKAYSPCWSGNTGKPRPRPISKSWKNI